MSHPVESGDEVDENESSTNEPHDVRAPCWTYASTTSQGLRQIMRGHESRSRPTHQFTPSSRVTRECDRDAQSSVRSYMTSLSHRAVVALALTCVFTAGASAQAPRRDALRVLRFLPAGLASPSDSLVIAFDHPVAPRLDRSVDPTDV